MPPAVLGLVHASCALGAAKSRQERADEARGLSSEPALYLPYISTISPLDLPYISQARGLPSELARRRPLRDVAAWLHVNSMRSEKMQA